MATYITAEPSIGELRFIARLNKSVLNTSAYPQSYTDQGSITVEGSDVFEDSSGQTYSKFYSSKRFIDDNVHCELIHSCLWIWVDHGHVDVSGSDMVVSMVIPRAYTGYESSSGGPFHRDINVCFIFSRVLIY